MNNPIFSLKNISKRYTTKDPLTLSDISLNIYKGETLGIAGESGSGKTTLAKILMGLLKPTSGSITYLGKEIKKLTKCERRDFLKSVQMIFQNPFSAVNPRFSVEDIIKEPLKIFRSYGSKKEEIERVHEVLDYVGLDPNFINKYPHQLSGGQRQRVTIARALASNPNVLILDEPTAALDVSIQAQILNLLKSLQQQLSLTYLFISHNLATLRFISDKISVMQRGTIIETSNATNLFTDPQEEYTRTLISSIPQFS